MGAVDRRLAVGCGQTIGQNSMSIYNDYIYEVEIKFAVVTTTASTYIGGLIVPGYFYNDC